VQLFSGNSIFPKIPYLKNNGTPRARRRQGRVRSRFHHGGRQRHPARRDVVDPGDLQQDGAALVGTFAAEKVSKKFGLGQEHAWNLFYCKHMHYISPAIFIAKCESLVNQWDTLWKSTPFGKQWLEAAEGNGFGGKLASAFMNMTVHAQSDNVTSRLKRVTSTHVNKDIDFTPEYCSQQIQLLQLFADDVERPPTAFRRWISWRRLGRPAEPWARSLVLDSSATPR